MKENKSIYIVGIFMLLTMVSIGYALLSGTLNINGNVKVKAATWDIYFKNIKVKSGSVTASVKPSITNKTTINFEIELSKPGDFYEFNVDVVNDGMIDAMVESISITPELTASQQKYLSYSVTYLDDVPLEVKDILHAQKSRTLKVKIEYRKNIENGDLLSSDETLNIKTTITYVQADSTAKETLSEEGEIFRSTTLVLGDGTQVGDEIAIGNEHFYVISNDGTDAVLLSKYNLNATPTYDSSITYKQNTDSTLSPVKFSETEYWRDYWSSIQDGTYLYNNNASISQYVDNYKLYLESLGVEISEARLIKKSELINLGCNNSNCNSTPEWLTSINYWTGSANVSNTIYVCYMVDYGVGYGSFNNANYSNDFEIGVRPVIVIPADSL